MVEFLLRNGARPTPFQPADEALVDKHTAKIMAYVPTAIDVAVRSEKKEDWDIGEAIMHLLIKAGADIRATNERGYTALHMLCGTTRCPSRVEAIIQTLLAKGCPANIVAEEKDPYRYTPLLRAAQTVRIVCDTFFCSLLRSLILSQLNSKPLQGNFIAVKALLESGMDVDLNAGLKCETVPALQGQFNF